jgi:hypothetical protein
MLGVFSFDEIEGGVERGSKKRGPYLRKTLGTFPSFGTTEPPELCSTSQCATDFEDHYLVSEIDERHWR